MIGALAVRKTKNITKIDFVLLIMLQRSTFFYAYLPDKLSRVLDFLLRRQLMPSCQKN